MPYPDSPTDRYSTDGEERSYEWQQSQPAATPPIVPYVPQPPAHPSFAEVEARKTRQAVTLRIVIALTMAVPLTAIGGSLMGGGAAGLLGMAMAWVGIAVVVYLSHGKGFPFPRD